MAVMPVDLLLLGGSLLAGVAFAAVFFLVEWLKRVYDRWIGKL